MFRLLIRNLSIAFYWTFLFATSSAEEALTADQVQFFETKIRPVLAEHCFECHSAKAEKVKGELLLDSRAAMLRGGAGGPAVVPFKPQESLLIEAIHYLDPDLAMPPKKQGGKLPDSVIADFEEWVTMGAPDPRKEETMVQKSYDPEKAKAWWSYQPVASPSVPTPKDSEWARTEIDRFILTSMEEKGIHPVGDADPASLLRRVFLDLTGLPPSPDFAAHFLGNPDPAVYEHIVATLLESPHFGERWGRHWLDVARYAETTGRDVNMTLPEAWRYRDYVIDAFAKDMPFDEFIREQIAGDLLPTVSEPDRAKKLTATGFLAVGPKGLNETDPRQFAVELAGEQIDAVTQAFLGMTVACARCHDHKFDPITQRDYTALAGIFLSSETHFGTPGGVRARNASSLIEVTASAGLETLARHMDPAVWAEKNSQREAIVARQAEALASRKRGGEGGNQVNGFDIVRMMTSAKQIEVELAGFNPDGTAKPRVMGVLDKPVTASPVTRRQRGGMVGGPNSGGRQSSGFETIGDSPFFARGDIAKEEEKVPRGIPSFLSGGKDLEIPGDASGRLELAEWIASTDNTLTSRVIVNRVWHWLFGRGLVESADNFGASGASPSHPELLDYLARQFVADGWSIKTLIKRMVTSRVYQLGSHHDETNFLADPDNHLLWRSNARRLDAETIRDSMLSASGLLDREPPIGSPIALAGDGPVGGQRYQVLKEEELAGAGGNFRSIYLPVARNVQPEVLSIFDFAEPSLVLGSRDTTIVPPQALFLLNSDFVDEQATAMAQRVMKEPDFDTRFALACRLTWCRDPLPTEREAAKRHDHNDLSSWTSICRALFASADFLFTD